MLRDTETFLDITIIEEVTEDQVRKEILHLDDSKATPAGDIPLDILKLTVDVHLSTPYVHVINLSQRKSYFPNDVKTADVSTIFIKDNNLEKVNYRPTSVLPHV